MKRLKVLVDRYLYFPSRDILYVPPMTKAITNLIRKDIADGYEICVITSVPPHSICIAGLMLKKNFPEIRWIVDWRDLWTYDDNYLARTPSLYRRGLYKLESVILNRCDVNVTTNEFAKEVLRSKYNIRTEKLATVNHHFNSNGRNACSKTVIFSNKSGHEPIKIGFLGTLFKPPRVPGDQLTKTIEKLRKDGLNLELHVFGKQAADVNTSSHHFAAKGIIFHGHFDHSESMRRISGCDYLLVFLGDLPNCRSVMSLKLAHYIGLDRPILAIVPDPSAIADIVRTTNTGHVIPVQSNWVSGLREFFSEPENSAFNTQRNVQEIEKFSWVNVSRQWVNVIDSHGNVN
ncbi:MAG: hypothetical protein ACE5EH_11200 [Gammaproteobacteria bacterium]